MQNSAIQGSKSRSKDNEESDDDLFDEANMKTTSLEDMIMFLKHKFELKAQKHSLLPPIASPQKKKTNKSPLKAKIYSPTREKEKKI